LKDKGALKDKKTLKDKYDGGRVVETMLEEAVVSFSENYGIWSEHATGKFAKAGKLRQIDLTFVR
jgi:hypothetical protein